MYYLIALVSAFDGLSAIIVSLLLTIAFMAALLKKTKLRLLTANLSWKKTFGIIIVSIVSLVLTTIVLGRLQAFNTYGTVVGAMVDEVLGASWTPLHALVGMALMALMPVLTNFFIIGSLILGIQYFREKRPTPQTDKTALKNALVWFVSLLLTPFVALIFTGFSFALSSTCNDRIGEEFNKFNAHLKSLCMERQDKSECPQDEVELRAFNPRAYDRLMTCVKSNYRFNAEKGEVRWLVKKPDGDVLVSHQDFYPGFGFFNRKFLPQNYQ